MPFVVVTPPAIEPVTLDQAKRHLRVDWSDDDAWIQDAISTARAFMERGVRRAFITQTLRATLQLPEPTQGRLSGSVGQVGWPLELPHAAPLQSVSLVEIETQIATYAGLTVTDDYLVDADAEPARIWLAAAALAKWSVSINYPGAMPRVRATYTCGYGNTPNTVPPNIRQAILNAVGHLYENREGAGSIPEALIPPEEVVMRL